MYKKMKIVKAYTGKAVRQPPKMLKGGFLVLPFFKKTYKTLREMGMKNSSKIKKESGGTKAQAKSDVLSDVSNKLKNVYKRADTRFLLLSDPKRKNNLQKIKKNLTYTIQKLK